MTLDEAIKQLKGLIPIPEVLAIREPFNYEKAIQLGIEGLERLEETRKSNPEAMPKVAYHSYLQLLPSETQ